MFTFFDCEVFKEDWMVVFKQDGQVTRIHNDREALRSFLDTVRFLIGFNNYNYDDKIMAALLKDMDPYLVSQKIITNKPFKLRLQNPITLDVMQEMKAGVSLKETQANLGYNIHETPVDFDIDRKLSKQEIERTFEYCENDVNQTERIFELREDYFAAKFEIVKEFGLKAPAIKKTRAGLSAEVLKAKPSKEKEDRLHLQYDERIPKGEIPEDIKHFYLNLEAEYKKTKKHDDLESKRFEKELAGIPHQYGFGGLHGARENFKHEGPMLQIDVSSYYPSLMINNGFMSRSSQEPELFQKLYDERMRLKKLEDSKQEIYKVLLNGTFGATKYKYNPLYDPRQFNNITVNGQLILTHLILLLEPFGTLIQSNTDGIIIAYDPVMKDSIHKVLELFQKQYELILDVDAIKKIAQRDVNNYVIQYENGKIKAKGRMANFEGGTYERNSLSIIDKALVDFYIHGKQVQRTVVECFKNNELHWFQFIAKAGRSFDGIVHERFVDTLIPGEVDSEFHEVQKVNRVFASKDKRSGGLYKTKHVEGTDRYNKVPWTSDHVLVWNGDISQLNKKLIDLNWYIQLIKKQLF